MEIATIASPMLQNEQLKMVEPIDPYQKQWQSVALLRKLDFHMNYFIVLQ